MLIIKAIKLFAPGDVRVEDVEIPELEAGNVLVKVKAVGICGSDIGRVNVFGAYRPNLTVGHEFSGEIVAVNEAGAWKVGDRVVVAPLIPCKSCQWCATGHYSLCESYDYFGSRRDGAMAEYVDVPVGNLLLTPDNVSFEAGAMTDPAANAIHAIWNGGLSSGETVAVFGAGPIGLFAIQFAKILGASRVIAVDIKDDKLAVAKNVGADEVINGLTEDPIEKLSALTGGKGINLVIETAGSRIAQNQAVCSAGKLARVVFVGISHDKLELSEKAVNTILRHELAVKGSWNSFSNPFPGREWTYSLELMSEGKLQTDVITSHRLSLDEGPEIFKKLMDKDFFFNKVLFLP
ncbi:zinc-binding dehydrogenase family protein [Desulfosporosinus sp. OT]|nr:zinc-binding dehydrogenase family protein [Desulfosporosinus sp. OT]